MRGGGGWGGWMGGSPCRMSIIRNGNVALSILRKGRVALSILRKRLCPPVEFKKRQCRMSLRPKNRPVDFRGLHPCFAASA